MAKKKGREKLEFSEMTVPELQAKLAEVKESNFRMRFRHAGSPLKNPMLIRQSRRDIARLITWLKQKSGGSPR